MSTIMDKIFEANSSFYVNTMGKVQFLFFRSCWLVLKKLLFREEDKILGYNSIKFDIFLTFLNILRFYALSRLATCEATRTCYGAICNNYPNL